MPFYRVSLQVTVEMPDPLENREASMTAIDFLSEIKQGRWPLAWPAFATLDSAKIRLMSKRGKSVGIASADTERV